MINWNDKFAKRTAMMKRSFVREILKLTQQPDIISFAGGLPAPELFPVEQIKEAADVVLAERGAEALQYGASEGVTELRDWIAARMSSGTVQVKRDNIIITNGAQQGVDLIGRVLLDEGDRIVVENPTYLGIFSAWRSYNLAYSTVPTDSDGLCVDLVEAVLRQNPKLMYLVPNFQNPQGVTLSQARRVELVKLLAKYQSVVVEDNPYGELRYSGEPVRPLYELDAQAMGIQEVNGHVIYVGTFSKVLTPGLRLGWVAGPVDFMERILQAKQGADLHTNTFGQLVAYEVLRSEFLSGHIERLRTNYRERRDVMLAAMEKYFPPEATWSHPEGGLFLMVTVPEPIDAMELVNKAIAHKVAFVPGADFHVGGAGRNTFRLNFSNAQPAMIEEGIRRLGGLLKQEIVKQRAESRLHRDTPLRRGRTPNPPVFSPKFSVKPSICEIIRKLTLALIFQTAMID